MTVLIDPILLVIFSGAMFFCSGFATYGCYRCYTDLGELNFSINWKSWQIFLSESLAISFTDASKVVPEGNHLGNRSRDRYRLRLFRRRPSTASSDATIYSVHSSEIWSRRSSPGLKGVLPSPVPSPFMRRKKRTVYYRAWDSPGNFHVSCVSYYILQLILQNL